MVRKLKYHEQKLLKKVDFINWECDNNLHEVKIMRLFHIQKREDYTLSMEDYITWAPRSKIRKRIEDYNGVRDDYDDV
ncbi:U3 small nucleolar ribonucleoprotein IMP3 [Schistosoma japonicum]|nr:U3 small nucleolar ribonucleoprotein IMP3 [Schistosoma japonicum]